MSAKSSLVVGFSISPTLLSAVVLSHKDFSIIHHVEKPLPSAIVSHDAKHVLDTPTLIPLIKEVMAKIGNPHFSDPVYLSIVSPFLTTTDITNYDNPQMIEEQIKEESLIKNESVLFQYSLLKQNNEGLSTAYTVIGNQLINDYISAFYEAGLKIVSIDILPLCILRTMAASGVLDSLLNKIGNDSVWGCFGISGSQTWCTIWQGTRLLQMIGFTTPADQKTWEERIIEFLHKSKINTEDVVVWLEWNESGMMLPVNPLKLKLNAPIRPVVLGKIYGNLVQSSFPALGAALKSEIIFPLGWNFLNAPGTESLKNDYKTVPYSNYQPVFPKIFYWISLIIFCLVITGSGYLWRQNSDMAHSINIHEKKLQMEVDKLLNTNKLYFEILEHVNKQNLAGLQVESVSFMDNGGLKISGQSPKKDIIDRFAKMLTDNKERSSLHIQINRKSIIPNETSTPFFKFELTGQAGANQSERH